MPMACGITIYYLSLENDSSRQAESCQVVGLPLLWAASAAASDWSLSEGITGHCFNQYYIISSPASIPMFIMCK